MTLVFLLAFVVGFKMLRKGTCFRGIFLCFTSGFVAELS